MFPFFLVFVRNARILQHTTRVWMKLRTLSTFSLRSLPSTHPSRRWALPKLDQSDESLISLEDSEGFADNIDHLANRLNLDFSHRLYQWQLLLLVAWDFGMTISSHLKVWSAIQRAFWAFLGGLELLIDGKEVYLDGSAFVPNGRSPQWPFQRTLKESNLKHSEKPLLPFS